MHDILTRGNGLLAQSVSALLTIFAVLTLLTALNLPEPKVNFSLAEISLSPSGIGKVRQDKLWMQYDVDADFTELMNFNTKEIFVTVNVAYDGDNGEHNEFVVWNRFIKNWRDAHFHFGERDLITSTKHGLEYTDLAQRMRGKKASIFIKWYLIPVAGILREGETKAIPIDFPVDYSQGV
eukprot:Clim_evm4s119 gene=Clim_evmTU4s119